MKNLMLYYNISLSKKIISELNNIYINTGKKFIIIFLIFITEICNRKLLYTLQLLTIVKFSCM